MEPETLLIEADRGFETALALRLSFHGRSGEKKAASISMRLSNALLLSNSSEPVEESFGLIVCGCE
ncbi:MAG: hypothetical protein ABUL64_03395 [Singulisphaera sp.]